MESVTRILGSYMCGIDFCLRLLRVVVVFCGELVEDEQSRFGQMRWMETRVQGIKCAWRICGLRYNTVMIWRLSLDSNDRKGVISATVMGVEYARSSQPIQSINGTVRPFEG